MQVGINGLFWPQERTGSGQYTRQLWQALHELAEPEVDFRLLGYGQNFEGVTTDKILQTAPPLPVRKSGKNGAKVWWEQWGFPQLAARTARRENRLFDVLHYPYFAAPLRPPARPTSTVVTIHDLIPLALPEYAASRPMQAYFKLVSMAARRADLIFTDSHYSKQDIMRLLQIPASKIAVIYLATDARYRPASLAPAEKTALFEKLGLPANTRLIYYIGGFDKRKNLPRLLAAFGRALPHLKELEGDERWILGLAGKPHSSSAMFPDLSGAIAEAVGADGPEADRIRLLGPVDEADKIRLYQAADMFVFPSTYEGFGLDPLEALACGTPVICSNATCLPEVVGQAAITLAPDDTEGWAAAMVELAANPDHRSELSRAGLQQAAKFSWQATARRSLELYQMLECIETRSPRR